MKLIQQILEERGGDINKSFTIIFGFGGYFNGVKRIDDYAEQKIILTVGDKKVTVSGERLAIGEYFEGDLFISGDIKVAQVE